MKSPVKNVALPMETEGGGGGAGRGAQAAAVPEREEQRQREGSSAGEELTERQRGTSHERG